MGDVYVYLYYLPFYILYSDYKVCFVLCALCLVALKNRRGWMWVWCGLWYGWNEGGDEVEEAGVANAVVLNTSGIYVFIYAFLL